PGPASAIPPVPVASSPSVARSTTSTAGLLLPTNPAGLIRNHLWPGHAGRVPAASHPVPSISDETVAGCGFRSVPRNSGSAAAAPGWSLPACRSSLSAHDHFDRSAAPNQHVSSILPGQQILPLLVPAVAE